MDLQPAASDRPTAPLLRWHRLNHYGSSFVVDAPNPPGYGTRDPSTFGWESGSPPSCVGPVSPRPAHGTRDACLARRCIFRASPLADTEAACAGPLGPYRRLILLPTRRPPCADIGLTSAHEVSFPTRCARPRRLRSGSTRCRGGCGSFFPGSRGGEPRPLLGGMAVWPCLQCLAVASLLAL